MNWEYEIVRLDIERAEALNAAGISGETGESEHGFEAILDRHGSEGWELVAIQTVDLQDLAKGLTPPAPEQLRLVGDVQMTLAWMKRPQGSPSA